MSLLFVLYNCGFHSACPLMNKDKRLMKLPDGRVLDCHDIEWFVLETNRDHSVIFETALISN